MEHVRDNNADIVFITETWLASERNNITATFKDYGYTLYHKIRKHDTKSRGGGVGLLCSSRLDITEKNLKLYQLQSFEYCVYSLKAQNGRGKYYPVVLTTLYRDQYVDIDIFLVEFEQLIQRLILTNNYLIVSGDFNIHWDSSDNEAARFSDLLMLYNMKQHVTQPTNSFGNILDLVITSNYDVRKSFKCPSVFEVAVSNVHLSDHFLVGFKINLEGSRKKQKTVYYRHFKSMNKTAFREDLSILILENIERYNESPFADRVKMFHSSLGDILDLHTPLKSKTVKDVPGCTWFNNDYVMMRRERRRAEKKAKKSGLTVDHDIFVELRNKTTKFAKSLKLSNVKNKIDSANGDQKTLFNVFNTLVDQQNEAPLPDFDNEKELAEKFSTFFVDKVKNIRDSFPNSSNCNIEYDSFEGETLSEFKLTNTEEIKSIIMEHGVKCSTADILPPNLINENIDLFLPIWVDLVNASLKQSSMDGIKLANIIPKLKGYDLDSEALKNFRPLSNLNFLSKLIERVVLKRLNTHMAKNDLNIGDQSGYKKGHSTETLMIKLTNDLLRPH